MLNVGSPAPKLTLQTLAGEPQPLSALYEHNPKTLLVFLRHLG
ncbi:hypothetical protein [Armatimonas sp.]|nr:hypothetical protein [Armatimonas sp.]